MSPWAAFNLSDHWHETHSMVEHCWRPHPARASEISFSVLEGLMHSYGPFESALNSFHSKTKLKAFLLPEPMQLKMCFFFISVFCGMKRYI